MLVERSGLSECPWPCLTPASPEECPWPLLTPASPAGGAVFISSSWYSRLRPPAVWWQVYVSTECLKCLKWCPKLWQMRECTLCQTLQEVKRYTKYLFVTLIFIYNHERLKYWQPVKSKHEGLRSYCFGPRNSSSISVRQKLENIDMGHVICVVGLLVVRVSRRLAHHTL